MAEGVPQAHSANFRHLYLDIAWYGVLSGSTMAFLSVYMVRLGASALQIGLVNAVPGLITILFALPVGWWLKRHPLDRSVFWSSIAFRFFYLLWVPLPILFSSHIQIELLIGLTFLMSIPGTALAVGFNALFAEAVPPEWRGKVIGVRNALLAVTYTTTSLICGFILDRFPFPTGYLVVFALGFLGAAMSSVHLGQVHVGQHKPSSTPLRRTQRNLAYPGVVRTIGDAVRPGIGLRFLARLPQRISRPLTILRGPFAVTLASLFLFHLTQHVAIPLYPLYWVERLGITDLTISRGNALFHVFLFAGSTQLAYLTRRWGNRRLAVAGALLLSVYPALTAITMDISMFLFTAIVGGLFAALSAGALMNYLLDRIPEEGRPIYLAWYVIILNGAVLLGSLLGPLLSRHLGLTLALFVSAGMRGLSGLVLWRWGR